MKKTNGDLKYQITDKLAVGLAWLNPGPSGSLYDAALTVDHPALSSQDCAALAATLVVMGFQKGWTAGQISAQFAKAVCDGDGIPSAGALPTDTEFIVGVEYASFDMSVGDKRVRIPKIKMTAYRPVDGPALDFDDNSTELFAPDTLEMDSKCRGVLELTISQGTLLITEHRGWLGSNEIVAYLRKSFEAAVSIHLPF